MKKTVIGFVVSSILGLTGGLVLAQEQTPAEAPQTTQPSQYGRAHHAVDPNRQAQRLAKKLNLTADQQNQILGILSAQRDQVQQLRADASLSKQDRHTKMQGIREEGASKMRALLTDDQKQKFDQLQQQRQEKQQNHKG